MGILLRNWHLKLSAVLLATVLYTGLVFSGSFSDATLEIRIEPANASRDTFVLSGDLGLVAVRYRVANTQQASVTASDFLARVDLSAYDLERAPEPQQLAVEVTSLRDGVEVLDVIPEFVRVEVDRIEVRTVPVEVEPGPVPDGLELGETVVSDDQVEVRGPASIIDQIDRAQALVDIPAAGIDVNDAVKLTVVDIEGQPVGTGMVDIEPETVSVQIDVRAVETQTTVAVRANLEPGAPAPGFALSGLSVEPSSVTITGLPEDLSGIGAIPTEAISIDGVSADQTFEVELELPDGVSLADGEPSTVTVSATIVPSVSSRVFVVGVVCEGAGDNACLPRLDQLAITLSGEGEALGGLDAADLTPTVDASGLTPGNYNLAPVISGLPEGVELIAVNPSSVPVTIVAPATPSPTPAP
jgi:YbbR domain-containing protein